MKNNGLFSSLFIKSLKEGVKLDDTARGRMATLAQTWRTRDSKNTATIWTSFMKQAVSYLEFVPPANPSAKGVYPLYEDWGYSGCVAVLYLIEPNADIDDTSVGRFYPAKLLAHLRERKLNWGILTDGAIWRLYSTKSSRLYEDYVELPLKAALDGNDEAEYGLFERFFHKDSFVPADAGDDKGIREAEAARTYKCRLDQDKEQSEKVLGELVKSPLLYQIDEVLQYLCNGFIQDTPKSGEEYTEEERAEIFESSVKLLYRCLFLFYAEAHNLLPSDAAKADVYRKHSIQALCNEARRFRWGMRTDTNQYDLWKRLKGLVNAVNDGDPEYGIMGYNGGLFDDTEERFLGQHQLRNDFLYRALYLLAYVEPFDNDSDNEYSIPYQDLEVRHLGELYENILEYTVQLADADRIRRRSKKGVELLLASQTNKQSGDTLIRKGEVFFGESALERKQTGSYYTPESLVRFLNEKTIIQPLQERFEQAYRTRFDEFLDEALNGPDVGERRGAAQSAAALVERFAEEEVLQFRACDPAMGSGHFLVDAANQMAGLVVELLEEIPDVDNLHVSVTSHPNAWRRLVTRHCLYGVDLNPLAVNLAKLSLWLNCFAKEHKLTFIDHHLRQGNSLIGLRSFGQLKNIPKRKKDSKRKAAQALLFNFDDLSDALTEAARSVASITEIAEDDTDTQKAVLEESYEATSERLKPLADLYTGYLMDGDITPEDYCEIFRCLAEGRSVKSGFTSDLPEVWDRLQSCHNRHQFFHWPLEFPEVFGPEAAGGFSGTVGNPPWDIVKLNPQEFFSAYDSVFRSYKKQEANRVARGLMEDNPAVAYKWELYCERIAEQNAYFKEPVNYSALGKGDVNTFKLFLEQFFIIAKTKGRMGIIVPSGIYTDQGCQTLRERFFNHSQIDFLYCFENRRAIFNIHRSFKFVLFGTTKGGTTDSFRCAFMKHDPETLLIIESEALTLSPSTIKHLSPTTLSICEFNSQSEVEISNKIYSSFPLLGDYSDKKDWHIDFHREFHMSDDSDLFSLEDEGLPLYEGKCIWQEDTFFSRNTYSIDERAGRKRLLRSKSDVGQTLDYEKHRLVYRKIARNTDERTIISTIIPPKVFTGENLTTSKNLFDCSTFLFIVGMLNSLCQDFIMRLRVTAAVNMYHMRQVPMPRLSGGNVFYDAIAVRVARLLCTRKELSELWSEGFLPSWTEPVTWYAESDLFNYGQYHEQEIRRRLRDDSSELTSEWALHFGVRERTTARRDTGDRAQLRAEIDAYVAHLYGLTKDDFTYVLDTFPVLKQKDQKAFGEFITKRKCLEEFDRLALMLGEEE